MSRLPSLEARASFGAVDTEIVAVLQGSGKKPIAPKGPYAGMVEKFKKSGVFNARLGQIQFVKFGGKRMAESVLFLGLGSASDLNEEKLRAAFGTVWTKLVAEKSKSAAIRLEALLATEQKNERLQAPAIYRASAEGLVLGAYQFKKYKSKADEETIWPSKIFFAISDKNKELKAQIDRQLSQAKAIAEAVNVTRDWSNEPSNIGTPEYYAEEAQKFAKEYGLKCRILTEKEAAREKMGLFLGVGQGAEREGRIIVLEYNPKGVAPRKTIALVGKGVTFDSGGISIKPSMRMEEMKHDMTGAATVFGAILLAASWQVPNRVVAYLAFTENMPDGNAIQPGNVLTARNGKTVEIINTDAEGRLVLADVLDYAHEDNPDAIIDVATLTGAVSVALGKYCCGILGNDDELIEDLQKAGQSSGERIWELPLYDDYFDDLKSDTADMKNSANDGNGGTIRGAIFLKQFIRKGTRWAHLDIAATAYNLNHLSYYPKKGASGAYVRTLAKFAADF